MKMPKPWFRKQNSTWYVSIDGRQHNLGQDEAKAKEAYHKLMSKQGRGVRPGTFTMRQVLAFYWDWLVQNRASSTASRRKPILESFGLAVSPTLLAVELRPYEVQKWIDKNDRIKSPTTAGDRVTLIKSVMNWAESMGYVDHNPIAKMPKPAPVVRQTFLPANTWQQVMELATDDEFLDFLTVMLASGARPTEMFRFEACHVSGSRFILPILESKGRKKSRVVYLPDEALTIVKKLAVEHPTGKLFRNSKGNPWDRNSIRCRFRRLKTELKLPELCSTTLRHSYAHHRLTSGQDALTVSKLMGHADTRMLSTRYGHLDANVDFMTQAANQIAFPLPTETAPSPAA